MVACGKSVPVYVAIAVPNASPATVLHESLWLAVWNHAPSLSQWLALLTPWCMNVLCINLTALIAFTYFLISCFFAADRRLNTLIIGFSIGASAFAIAHGMVGSEWMHATGRVRCSLSNYHAGYYIPGELTVSIGLQHYNITLSSLDYDETHFTVRPGSFSYRESFPMNYGREQGNRIRALEKGLPEVMVIVAEYLDMRGGGTHTWGDIFPFAGYFAYYLLYFATASLILSMLFVVLIPKYSIFMLLACGLFCLATVYNYINLLPRGNIPPIYVLGKPFHFKPSATLYALLIVGIIDVLTSAVLLIIYKTKGNNTERLATFFEMDYDTPWDRLKLARASRERRRTFVSISSDPRELTESERSRNPDSEKEDDLVSSNNPENN